MIASDELTWRDGLSATAPPTRTRRSATSELASPLSVANPLFTSSTSSLFLAPSSGLPLARAAAPAARLAGGGILAGACFLGPRGRLLPRLLRRPFRCRRGASLSGGLGRACPRLRRTRRRRRRGRSRRRLGRGPVRATLPGAQVLFEVLEVAEDDRRLTPKRTDYLRRGVPAVLDEAAPAARGLLTLRFPATEQLLRHLFGPPCSHARKRGGRLAQAFQIILGAHIESVWRPPGEPQG